MEIIRLKANEYVIENNAVFPTGRDLCISEINEIKDGCIRDVSRCVIFIPSTQFIVISSIILFFVGFLAFLFAYIYRNTGLVYLFFLGLVSFILIPVFIFSCLMGAKKKREFIKTAEIFPAEITGLRAWEKYREGDEGGGYWVPYYEIKCCVFTGKSNIYHRFYYPPEGWFTKDKKNLFNYYREKRFMFVLINPKKKKVYPVRLYKKDGTLQMVLNSGAEP